MLSAFKLSLTYSATASALTHCDIVITVRSAKAVCSQRRVLTGTVFINISITMPRRGKKMIKKSTSIFIYCLACPLNKQFNSRFQSQVIVLFLSSCTAGHDCYPQAVYVICPSLLTRSSGRNGCFHYLSTLLSKFFFALQVQYHRDISIITGCTRPTNVFSLFL